MRFKVNRASGTEPPCKGAVLEKYTTEWKLDLSKMKKNDRVHTLLKHSHEQKGVNCKIENDWLIKEFEQESWFIEINSIEELMTLVEKEGHIVLASDEITIYDDYLE